MSSSSNREPAEENNQTGGATAVTPTAQQQATEFPPPPASDSATILWGLYDINHAAKFRFSLSLALFATFILVGINLIDTPLLLFVSFHHDTDGSHSPMFSRVKNRDDLAAGKNNSWVDAAIFVPLDSTVELAVCDNLKDGTVPFECEACDKSGTGARTKGDGGAAVVPDDCLCEATLHWQRCRVTKKLSDINITGSLADEFEIEVRLVQGPSIALGVTGFTLLVLYPVLVYFGVFSSSNSTIHGRKRRPALVRALFDLVLTPFFFVQLLLAAIIFSSSERMDVILDAAGFQNKKYAAVGMLETSSAITLTFNVCGLILLGCMFCSIQFSQDGKDCSCFERRQQQHRGRRPFLSCSDDDGDDFVDGDDHHQQAPASATATNTVRIPGTRRRRPAVAAGARIRNGDNQQRERRRRNGQDDASSEMQPPQTTIIVLNEQDCVLASEARAVSGLVVRDPSHLVRGRGYTGVAPQQQQQPSPAFPEDEDGAGAQNDNNENNNNNQNRVASSSSSSSAASPASPSSSSSS